MSGKEITTKEDDKSSNWEALETPRQKDYVSWVSRDVRDEQNNELGSNPRKEHSSHKDRGMKKPGMFEAKIGF